MENSETLLRIKNGLLIFKLHLPETEGTYCERDFIGLWGLEAAGYICKRNILEYGELPGFRVAFCIGKGHHQTERLLIALLLSSPYETLILVRMHWWTSSNAEVFLLKTAVKSPCVLKPAVKSPCV